MIEAAFSAAVPLILAGLGGLISEQAGVLNISLEGCIGIGAFVVVLLSALGFPITTALMASALAGLLYGTVLASVHLGLGSNLFIAGLGINLLTPSLTGLMSQFFYGNKGNIRMDQFMTHWLPWIMLPLALATLYGLKYTALGRHIRAAGTRPDFLDERGISSRGVRLVALLISSLSASMAGAAMSLRIGAYVPGMSAGKGWIALVLIWMGFRHPLGVLLAAYAFSMFEVLSGRIQGLVHVSASLMLALPYVAALIALTLSSALNGSHRRQ